MRIVIIGSGYVGLVSGACFAEMGNRVVCVDSDAGKIDQLNRNEIPIFEPGLEEMVRRGRESGDLSFTTDLAAAIKNAEIAFIAVGTPMGADGSADLSYVLAVADEIGRVMSGNLVVVDKSTVPVGTADRVRETIAMALERRANAGQPEVRAFRFDVVSNPEFLKEGCAIADFLKPDRIVVGADSAESHAVMAALYEPFMKRERAILAMDIRSAEMTKYAANAMLATRISFMNEIALLCEKVGANINQVRVGIGSDSRIGRAFLFPGCGYGGSCFPKDVQALRKMMRDNDLDANLLDGVESVNRAQKKLLARKVTDHFGDDLSGKTFAVWGLAFKPNTDDMREAPAIETIRELVAHGGKIRVFDPEAMEQGRTHYLAELKNHITYCENKYDALDGASALLLLTEWSAFRSPDFDEMRTRLGEPVIFDGRNQYDPALMKKLGFTYRGIGLGAS